MIIFRPSMHRGQKLKLRLCRSSFCSWVPLGETGLVPSNVRLICSVCRPKTKMKERIRKSQNRTEENLIRIDRTPPEEKHNLLRAFGKTINKYNLAFCAPLQNHAIISGVLHFSRNTNVYMKFLLKLGRKRTRALAK